MATCAARGSFGPRGPRRAGGGLRRLFSDEGTPPTAAVCGGLRPTPLRPLVAAQGSFAGGGPKTPPRRGRVLQPDRRSANDRAWLRTTVRFRGVRRRLQGGFLGGAGGGDHRHHVRGCGTAVVGGVRERRGRGRRRGPPWRDRPPPARPRTRERDEARRRRSAVLLRDVLGC